MMFILGRCRGYLPAAVPTVATIVRVRLERMETMSIFTNTFMFSRRVATSEASG